MLSFFIVLRIFQPAFTSSKSTMENKNMLWNMFKLNYAASLLLTLNSVCILFWRSNRWLWQVNGGWLGECQVGVSKNIRTVSASCWCIYCWHVPEAFYEPSGIFMMELFSENSERILTVGYFCQNFIVDVH